MAPAGLQQTDPHSRQRLPGCSRLELKSRHRPRDRIQRTFSGAVAFARATKADFRSALSGIASVYHGGVTATGEHMNPDAMTAAHKTLAVRQHGHRR
jgi:rare lipoprotein A (peptidoglycan hydrolase)